MEKADKLRSRVCILILNWNNWQDTVECLESVFQGSYREYQVVVVDNDSTDSSEKKIKEWAEGKIKTQNPFIHYNTHNKPIPFVSYDRQAAESGGNLELEKSLSASLTGDIPHPLVFIQTGVNLGYAWGNNIGLRFALKRVCISHIWILNNDTVCHLDALKELMACIESDNNIGAAGSKLLYYDRPDILHLAGGCRITPWLGNTSMIGAGKKDDGKWDRPLEPDYISGASMLIKKKVLEDVGLLDERYFLYWEDADLGMRMRRMGYRLLYCPASRVWHQEGGSVGRLSRSADYYWVRNGLYFMQKFYPGLLPIIPLSYFLKFTLLRLVKRQPLHFSSFLSGVKDFITGKTGPRVKTE